MQLIIKNVGWILSLCENHHPPVNYGTPLPQRKNSELQSQKQDWPKTWWPWAVAGSEIGQNDSLLARPFCAKEYSVGWLLNACICTEDGEGAADIRQLSVEGQKLFLSLGVAGCVPPVNWIPSAFHRSCQWMTLGKKWTFIIIKATPSSPCFLKPEGWERNLKSQTKLLYENKKLCRPYGKALMRQTPINSGNKVRVATSPLLSCLSPVNQFGACFFCSN